MLVALANNDVQKARGQGKDEVGAESEYQYITHKTQEIPDGKWRQLAAEEKERESEGKEGGKRKGGRCAEGQAWAVDGQLEPHYRDHDG
jgi:hypothetical protein